MKGSKDMKPRRKTLISAMLAGMAIAIGCEANVMSGNRFAGAVFFSIGLICVCSFQWDLFTGKVPFVRTYYDSEILPVIWVGNVIGAIASGSFAALARMPVMSNAAQELWRAKLSAGPASALLSAFCCNVLIYIAVKGFREVVSNVGKYLCVIFAVSVFVLCGFEHCIADAAYMSMAGDFSLRSILFLLFVTVGNLFGGLTVRILDDMQKGGST